MHEHRHGVPSLRILPVLDLQLEELGHGEGEGHDDHGDDVEPGLAGVWAEERVAQPEVPLDADGQRHEDGPHHGHLGHRVDEVGEEVGEDVGVGAERAGGVVDAAAHQVQRVEARQGEQELRQG